MHAHSFESNMHAFDSGRKIKYLQKTHSSTAESMRTPYQEAPAEIQIATRLDLTWLC